MVPGEKDNYFRGHVENVEIDGKNADIFFLDYGNTESIPISKLRELNYEEDEDLINIPTQALQCRLACIKPAFNLKTKPGEWPKAATIFFRNSVYGKDLIARVRDYFFMIDLVLIFHYFNILL